MDTSERAAEVEQIMQHASGWAATRPDARALILVGSWARGAARPDSDVDLVVLTTTPDAYTFDVASWMGALGARDSGEVREWGPVTSVRLVRPSGLEVEVGIGPLSWAQTDPVDAGTRDVLAHGYRILHDPDGRLERLVAACRLEVPGDRGPS